MRAGLISVLKAPAQYEVNVLVYSICYSLLTSKSLVSRYILAGEDIRNLRPAQFPRGPEAAASKVTGVLACMVSAPTLSLLAEPPDDRTDSPEGSHQGKGRGVPANPPRLRSPSFTALETSRPEPTPAPSHSPPTTPPLDTRKNLVWPASLLSLLSLHKTPTCSASPTSPFSRSSSQPFRRSLVRFHAVVA